MKIAMGRSISGGIGKIRCASMEGGMSDVDVYMDDLTNNSLAMGGKQNRVK